MTATQSKSKTSKNEKSTNCFTLYIEEEGALSRTAELCSAVGEFIQSDVPVAAEVVFVEAEEIQTLNREQRQVDSITDVLSFPTLDGIRGRALHKKEFPYDMDENGNLFIGSIVICRQRAREQAEEYGHSYERELYYLLVHGILHCLGYDHMTDEDKAEMREKEEEILGKMGITRE
jgi:probable rRNA maturation factor